MNAGTSCKKPQFSRIEIAQSDGRLAYASLLLLKSGVIASRWQSLVDILNPSCKNQGSILAS